MSTITKILQSDWADHVGLTLLHSLWQIMLVATIYAIISVLLRKRTASVRYVMGCVALSAMLGFPLCTCLLLSLDSAPTSTGYGNPPGIADLSVRSPTKIIARPEIAVNDTVLPPNLAATERESAKSIMANYLSALRAWLPWATVVWLVGALLFLLRPMLGWLHVCRLQRHGLSSLPDKLRHLEDRLVDRLGVRQAIRFGQSTVVDVPSVVGYFRPVVLLPISVITNLSVTEIELILAHELAHVRRHDFLVNLVQTVIEASLFYHPGMWWLSSQIRQERENCCDDMVIALNGNRIAYVQALVRFEEQRLETPAILLAATGGSLMTRIRRLLGQPTKELDHLNNAAACFFGLITLSVVALIASSAIATGETEPTASNSEQTPEVQVPKQATSGPHDIVDQYLDRIRDGKKTIDGISGSWQHVWELTTRDAGAGWGEELIKMSQNPKFRASVAIGNQSRALVLTKPIRYNSRDSQYIGVFDVVNRDGHWLVQKVDYWRAKEAWALAHGFARDPKVRFLVQPENIIGTHMPLASGINYEFLPDGQYRHTQWIAKGQKKIVDQGTWHLDGATLVRITEKGETRQQVTKLSSDGFSLCLSEKHHREAVEAGFNEVHLVRFDLPSETERE